MFSESAEQPTGQISKIFIGNLPYRAREGDLRTLFERFGSIRSIRVVTDKETRRSKGFAFLEIEENVVGSAVKELNSINFQGRQLIVSEAKPKFSRDQGSSNTSPESQVSE